MSGQLLVTMVPKGRGIVSILHIVHPFHVYQLMDRNSWHMHYSSLVIGRHNNHSLVMQCESYVGIWLMVCSPYLGNKRKRV